MNTKQYNKKQEMFLQGNYYALYRTYEETKKYIIEKLINKVTGNSFSCFASGYARGKESLNDFSKEYPWLNL